MNRSILNRVLSAALVLMLALALAAPAMAATAYVIATDDTIVRKGPGTGYSKLGTLEEDEVVVKVGTSGVWTKVIFDDEYGYVKTADVETYKEDDLIIIGNSSSGSSSTVVATANVNVRSGPGTNYSILGSLTKGTTVTKVGATGNWTIINWKTGTAYVSSSYLSASSSGSGSSTSGTTMAATANVNVRSGPGTKYSILGFLTKGEKITKTGVSGSWTQVSYKGKTAYVHSAYLAVSSGSSGGGSTTSDMLLYALEDDTPIRSGPSKAYRAIGYLDEGDTVKYIGTNGTSWYKVQLGSTLGYVHVADVIFRGAGSTTSSGGYVYASSTVRVYEEPSTSAYTLGYLYAGDTAERTGKLSSGWTRIDFDGEPGYVQTARITVISDAGSSTGGMSTLNKWMAAINNYTYCYSVPTASKTYREGYLDKNERVWAISGNSSWIKVLIDDEIYYVQAGDLKNASGSSSSGSSSKYSIGSTVYVAKYAGAATYATGYNDTPFKVEKPSSSTMVEYGDLSRGTKLTVKLQDGDRLLVSFRDDRDTDDLNYTGKTYSAYVDIDRVTSTRP